VEIKKWAEQYVHEAAVGKAAAAEYAETALREMF